MTLLTVVNGLCGTGADVGVEAFRTENEAWNVLSKALPGSSRASEAVLGAEGISLAIPRQMQGLQWIAAEF